MPSAAQRFVAVPELLEMVVTRLPTWQIREVKFVGREWRDIVNCSSVVRKARLVHPRDADTAYRRETIYVNEHGDGWPTEQDWQEATCEEGIEMVQQTMLGVNDSRIHDCEYLSHDWLRLNPIFPVSQYIGPGEAGDLYDEDKTPLHQSYVEVEFEIPEHYITPEEMGQFVTEPPCTCMEVITAAGRDRKRSFDRTHHGEPWEINRAWAWNPKGLKVQDIYYTRDALQTAQDSYTRNRTLPISEFIGAFRVRQPNPEVFPETELDEVLNARNCGWPRYYERPLPRYRHVSDPPSDETDRKRERDAMLETEAEEKARKYREKEEKEYRRRHKRNIIC